MTQKLRVVFDGKVFCPSGVVNLPPNAEYFVTIEPIVASPEDYPLTVIGRLATDMGIVDLGEKHDQYARGKLEEDAQ